MTPTRVRANGKWHAILPQLGVPEAALSGNHGPCPMCGGKDRFRFINTEGNGTYICSQCGGGDALDLLMNITGESFKDCARKVDALSGKVKAKTFKPSMSQERRVELLNNLYADSRPATKDDLVGIYLQARGFDWIPDDVLFCRSCRAPNGTTHPAMIAMIRDVEGVPASMHRTFLGRGKKADMEHPRALMKSVKEKLPDGACIRLGPVGKHIGVAEGIETAMAAKSRFGVTTWATISSELMKKWLPPAGVEKVTIFGDCDPKYGGQAAAFHLAHKLAVRNIAVQVQIPDKIGTDWADR